MKLGIKKFFSSLSASLTSSSISDNKNFLDISFKTYNSMENDFKGKRLNNGKYEYLGNKKLSQDGYVYKKGSIPILISTPHSIKQPGRSGNKYKSQDMYTGAIGKIVAEKTGAHLIYKSHFTGVDDNYITSSNNDDSLETPYRKKIKEVINENEIKLVIDLHGFNSVGKNYAVELGTNHKENLVNEKALFNTIIDAFKECGFVENSNEKDNNLAVDKYFTASKTNVTVSNYVATTLKTPAIQIEMGSDFRKPQEKGMTNINKMISAIINIVNKVNENTTL